MDIVHDSSWPVQLPTRLFTALLPYLDAEAFKLLAYILYRTYNYKTTILGTSLQELHAATNLPEAAIVRCLADPVFRLATKVEVLPLTDTDAIFTITLIEDPAPGPSVHGAVLRAAQRLQELHPTKSIHARDNDTCQYCGIVAADQYETDHIIPRALGGLDRPYNLVLACRACNQRKRARVWIPRNLDAITANHPEHRARVLALAVPHE